MLIFLTILNRPFSNTMKSLYEEEDICCIKAMCAGGNLIFQTGGEKNIPPHSFLSVSIFFQLFFLLCSIKKYFKKDKGKSWKFANKSAWLQ